MRSDTRGFTLVELMVVVAILGLLAGMVMPVLSGVMILAKVSATNGQMGSLDVALHAYSDEFDGRFPPSSPDQVAKCADGKVGSSYSGSGAENLYFFLTGWKMSGSTVIQGQGYEITDLGGLTKEVKPFYTPAKDEWKSAIDPRYGFSGGANGNFIADKFDGKRPIIYFKAGSGSGSNPFVESDNTLPVSRWKASPAKSFNDFVVTNGIPRSNDFLLWSAGADEKFFSEDDVVH